MHSFDLHVHTVHSGDSPCNVESAVESAKEKGLSGIAVTDHDTVDGLAAAFEAAGKDFLIIPGIEVSSRDGHILGLGIEEEVPSGLSASETVERIRRKEGIAVAAHPFALGLKPFSALRADFDAIETFNPRRYLGNRLAKGYALEHNVPVSAGSDAHLCDEVGMAGVNIDCELKVESVLKKIKRGKASVFGRTLPPSSYLRRALFRVLRL